MDSKRIHYFRSKSQAILDAANKFRRQEEDLNKRLLDLRINCSGRCLSVSNEISRIDIEIQDLIKKFNCFLSKLSRDFDLIESNFSDLTDVIIESKSLISYFDSMISPLGNKENIQIQKLRERITGLSCKDILKRNLEYSLSQIENGFALSSVLISGRVISYCVDSIRGESKEEKLQVLENTKAILNKDEDKSRADKKRISQILEEHMPSKQYRNLTSHNIGYFPEIEDAFKEISNAMIMINRISELSNYG